MKALCVLILKYRARLSRYIKTQKQWHVPSLIDISFNDLKRRGIQAIILDFDGVLAPHGALEPLEVVQRWLKEAPRHYGRGRLFILSNATQMQRIQYMQIHFPEWHFLKPIRKKPFPEGIQEIQRRTGLSPHAIVMIDDRLLTGILAALQTGVCPLWVTQPFTCFWRQPFVELWYSSLRFLERHIFQYMP
jgi:HAD superfamily phosphatase (TIGR01668 family)